MLPVFAGLLATPAVLDRFAESQERENDWRERLTGYLRAERDLTRLAADADIDAATAILVGICHDAVLTTVLPGAPSAPIDVEAVVTTLLTGIEPS